MLVVEEEYVQRRSSEEFWQAFSVITEVAERFVNRSPRLKRLEAERQALLDAIRQAQLLLSVKRLPTTREPSNSRVLSLERGRTRRQRQGARSTRAT